VVEKALFRGGLLQGRQAAAAHYRWGKAIDREFPRVIRTAMPLRVKNIWWVIKSLSAPAPTLREFSFEAKNSSPPPIRHLFWRLSF